MMPHENSVDFRLLKEYVADEIGAPFRVLLKDSVCAGVDLDTGAKRVQIPDLKGLISEVVRLRVTDARKMSGEDIRFVRRALALQAKWLAAYLDVTPEHYSRWESGGRVMPSATERCFRLFAFAATLVEEPEALASYPEKNSKLMKSNKKSEELAKNFVDTFLRMKIDPVRDADDQISYVLLRNPQPQICASDQGAVDIDEPPDLPDGDWTPAKVA